MSEPRSITENAPGVIAEAVRWARRTRFNPLAALSGPSLTRALEGFERGELREAALLWDAIARRDDTIPSVKTKREKSVAHKPLETVTLEKSPEADAHREVLEAFWKNARFENAWDRNDRGGVQKLIRSMQSAVSFGYAAHHIVWRPTAQGLRATFEYVPTWFFESRDAVLRFLPSGYGLEGQDLEEQNWLISCGDALMIAGSIGYYMKRSVLMDWLRFSEKFAMPGVFGKTSAEKDSEEGRAMRDAVASFGQEWAAVLYGFDGSKTSGIELIQANGNPSAMPMPALIERVDKKIAALYRGADLSTMSSGSGAEGTGASLQGEEQDILERADAADRSEELQAIERTVIAWHFGAGVEPLAQTRLIVPEREDQKLLLDATKTFVDMGARLSTQGTLARFGMSEADSEESVLIKSDAAKPSNDPGAIDHLAAAINAVNDAWRYQRRDERGRWTDEGGRSALFSAAKDLLETQGGFTIEPATGHPRKSGFAVAPSKETERRIPLDQFDEAALRSYLRDHRDLLMTENAHLGGWVYDGHAYLDVSIVVDDFDDALRLATLGDQIAFYDLAKGEEINTQAANERKTTGNAGTDERSEVLSIRQTEDGRDLRTVRGSDGRRGEKRGTDQSGRDGEDDEDEELIEPPFDQVAALLLHAVIEGLEDASTAGNTATTDAIWKDGETSGGDRLPKGDREVGTASNAAAIEPDADGWYQIAPYGEFPTVDGKLIQVFGPDQARAMVKHFNSLPFRITRWLFNNEVPVFIGHPDVDRKNWADERKLAVRHTELAAREDGLWGRANWNDLGRDNLANGYWQYPSPVWLYPKPDSLIKRAGAKLFGRETSNRVFPDILQSVGLTNFQNIPGARRVTHNALASGDGTTQENEDDMIDPKLLAALKLPEDATIEQVLEKIAEITQAAEAQVAEKTTMAGELTAANAALDTVRGELQTLRTTTANALLDTAIGKGAITQGERKGWENRFATDYDAAANALAEVQPGASGLHTKGVEIANKPETAPETPGERIAAFNAAVKTYSDAHPGDGYDACVAAVRKDPAMKHLIDAMDRKADAED